MQELVRIEELPRGVTAKVIDLIGQPQHVSRFCEIGLRIGVTLQMVQVGMACVVRINGSKLCLRPRGVQVMVQPC